MAGVEDPLLMRSGRPQPGGAWAPLGELDGGSEGGGSCCPGESSRCRPWGAPSQLGAGIV